MNNAHFNCVWDIQQSDESIRHTIVLHEKDSHSKHFRILIDNDYRKNIIFIFLPKCLFIFMLMVDPTTYEQKAIRNAKQQHMMSNDPINVKEVQQGSKCRPFSSPSCIDAAIQTGLLVSCSWRSFIFLASIPRTLKLPTARF